MSGRVEGKVALVTGGASGLGYAIVRALASEGARVVVADISGQQDDVAAELGEAGHAVHADVSVEEDVRDMIEAAVEKFGRLDVLCNNAGIDGDLATTAEMATENFDRVVAVNLRSVFLGHKHGIPAMVESGGGSVINTASVAARAGMPTGAAYCAAKTGVLGLTRVAAIEYAQAGVRVNAICPAVIQTPMVEALGDDPAIQTAIQMTPVGRIGKPEEIGSVALFLASDESSYITGVELPVDGGYGAI